MRKLAVVGVVVLVLVGIGFFSGQFLQINPADVAENFIEQVAERDFSDLEKYFGEAAHPTEAELKEAYDRFAHSFALTNIAITDFAPLSQNKKEAVFHFELAYESSHFDPLVVESNLVLKRKGFFDEWKLEWQNNLPLPHYGLKATYTRSRLESRRGNIIASNGEILAGEGSLVAVGVQPDRITDPELLLATLKEQLGLSEDYVRRQYEAPGVQGHWFVPLVTLSEQQYLAVDEILRPVPGVFFKRVEARAYPQREITAHLTGYLGEVTSSMLEDFPERDYLSGEIVGRAGLEGSRDDLLRGRPGYRFYVQPEEGSQILLAEKPLVPQEDLELTLDVRLQTLAYEMLQDRQGAFVLLDAETGAILALASTPSYDPNEFVVGISSKRWQELSTDPQKPMFNRATQGLYPPGSVFKVITTAAALDQGVFEPTSEFVDTGELRVEGNIIRNFQQQVFGEHDLNRALVESINTTIAKVGLEIGAPVLEEYFTRFGLNQAPRLGLSMAKGSVGTPKRSKVALAWSAIGQDQVLLSPLHMAQIFTVFANGGLLPPIHLIKTDQLPEATEVLKVETVEQMNAMLKEVVLSGTGRGAQVAGLDLFAKTGTAEIVGGGNHAWFAGHTQLPEGRKVAFALLVEEGGVGGQIAAPLVRDYFGRLVH
ncbi:MAG: hypothetical protein GX956_01370 [Firmicutes bacterium]|nr:hypothetical protein [Bacillota bacterium]